MTLPAADRPFLRDYGIPTSTDGLVAWSWAVQRLERAQLYSMATASADGIPHAIPIWGAWVDGRWYVEGGNTRWQRNLRANPRMAINVTDGGDVVIVEGTATELVAPAAPLAERIVAGFAKYKATKGYEARPENWAAGGLWELRPVKAFAWSTFPDDVTRFRF